MNLKNNLLKAVGGTKNLSELVDTFENICKANIKEDDDEDIMILFETGTFDCIDEKMFHFSLARQWPIDAEEYCYLRLNILYQPNEKNAVFSMSMWDEEIDTDFFSYIRQSTSYLALMQEKIIKVDIYQEAITWELVLRRDFGQV